MPIFESKGLLEGKRLRKCSATAHALWPFIFGMASDKYARLEVDGELIAGRLMHLRELLDEETDDGTCIEEIVKQYVEEKLAFPYEHNGVQWIAFDLHHHRDYATVEDKASPEPPEPAYTDWIKELHGEGWQKFHPGRRPTTEVSEDISRKRSEAGRKGAMTRWYGKDDSLPDLPAVASLPLSGVGVGSGVGVVKGSVTGEETTTVRDSTAQSVASSKNDKSEKPEKQTDTETSRRAMEFVEGYWDIYNLFPAKNVSEVVDDPGNFEKLLTANPNLTIEDLHGVLIWMIYVNNEQYWLKNVVHNSGDFCRAFRKMHEQYEKCGGYKVAKVAERAANQKEADEKASLATLNDPRHQEVMRMMEADLEPETFRMIDIDDADGLT